MPVHQVMQGECLSSIAEQYGLSWKTIWNDPNNAGLKRLRKDPNVLAPGDEIYVPELRIKTVNRPTEARHTFVKLGVPAMLKIKIMEDGIPRANVPYTLRLRDGTSTDGTTDEDGFVTASIRPGVESGEIIITENGNQDVYPFDLGTVDPIDTDEGIQGRLHNLGYPARDDLEAALRSFQEKEGLEATGAADEATRARLKERFGE